jgi:hypothetical protein
MSNTITVSPSQLEASLQFSLEHRFNLLIVGAPGIGKTEIVNQACSDAGMQMIVSHPVVSDPTDYKGLPFVVNGDTADFLPFGDLRKLIEATEDTVFFLDDIGQAPPSVQAAAMQLLLARRINGHKVSEHVRFIAATNRRQDRAGVQGVLEPVKSRFASILHLETDPEDWIKWALSKDLPTELVAFIRFRPDLLSDFKPTNDMVNSPSPRTVAFVGQMMQKQLPHELEYAMISGATGEGFAIEFKAFLDIYRNLPNPDLIILSPDEIDVPEDPSTLYALSGALARKAGPQNFANIIKYTNRMPAEFSVLTVKDAVNRNQGLTSTRPFIEWASQHSDVLL